MKKYFLTKKQLNYIIQKYGSGHRWSLHEDMSEHGRIIYMDSLDYMLSVNLFWEGSEGKFPYIGIHLANSTGTIIRKDRYEYCSTDRTRFEFIQTEESGCFYDEFRPINKPSATAKRNKNSNTCKLEQRLSDTTKLLESAEKRLRTLVEQAEQGFLNSPTYHQMQQEIDFYKSLNKLNEIHIANAKKQVMKATEHIQQIYDDNTRMCEHEGDMQYWVGITECWRDAKDFDKLREEIRILKGKVEQTEQAIADRDTEIRRLQLVIGEMRCRRNDTPASTCEERKEMETLHAENDELKKHITGSEKPLSSHSSNTTPTDEAIRIIERNIEHQINSFSKKKGRPPQVDEQKLCLLIELRKKGYPIRHIAEQLGMSVGNAHRYIKLHETREYSIEEKP